MKTKIMLIAGLIVTGPVLGQSVYKCSDPVSGVVKFSQQPCTNKGEGEIVNVKPIPKGSGNSPTGLPDEEANRAQELAKKAGRERRLLEIDREIKTLEEEINNYRITMDEQLANLKDKKSYATNSLAGAAWEQSISSEMSAVSSKYDSLIRSNQSRIEQLRREKDHIREEMIKEKQTKF